MRQDIEIKLSRDARSIIVGGVKNLGIFFQINTQNQQISFIQGQTQAMQKMMRFSRRHIANGRPRIKHNILLARRQIRQYRTARKIGLNSADV